MPGRIPKQLTMITIGAALLVPGMALAEDGVILIDQDRVLAGNVTPGASPGFPLAIRQPGSYRLPGNLNVPDADTTAIEIAADSVTIDLNGFAIQRPAHCQLIPVFCFSTGTGNGVHVVNRDNIVVTNGTIQGMGNLGLFLETSSARIEKMTLLSNGGGGVTFFGGSISGSIVASNGGDGIFGLDIIVLGNFIHDNRFLGLHAYGRSAYGNNVFSGNNMNAAQVNNNPSPIGGNVCNAAACP